MLLDNLLKIAQFGPKKTANLFIARDYQNKAHQMK